jgi:hypothetical protein
VVEAHKEKFPPTTTNFSDQQHKEKIPSTTENNDNLSNNSSRTDSEPKKLEIKFTPDYEAEKPIFLSVFEELANDNNGLVYHDKLQERLVSTGKFFVGDEVLMIEHMEKIGEIEQTEQYHVYRRKIAASPEHEYLYQPMMVDPKQYPNIKPTRPSDIQKPSLCICKQGMAYLGEITVKNGNEYVYWIHYDDPPTGIKKDRFGIPIEFEYKTCGPSRVYNDLWEATEDYQYEMRKNAKYKNKNNR